jgi:pimeloyl-ACP methyl ester carboxylesterase
MRSFKLSADNCVDRIVTLQSVAFGFWRAVSLTSNDRWGAMDRRNDRQQEVWRKTWALHAAVVFACCFGGVAFHAVVLRAQTLFPEKTNTAGDVDAQRTSPDTVLHCPAGTAEFRDETFDSKVFGGPRHYRIFLPTDYDAVSTRYPVIYYLHGHSDRYTLEDYDHGEDTVPKICRFVATHAVMVVGVDGYIARDYTGFYGGDPYDVRRTGGDIDFGKYFLEQVAAIDANYRTLTSRRYRATSGLSMGGFMSLYLSARYPQIIGSCSAFNPGPEFYAGEKGRRSLWRPKDYVLSYQHTPVRLVRASGDYISQYTEETRAAFAATPSVEFEFRQDEYDRHWATSIAETFDFHMRAFADPSLDTTPTRWNYASAFDRFNAWGYHVQADIAGPAMTYLQHVSQAGMMVTTRQWAPDGPSAVCTQLKLTTAGLYQRGATYKGIDLSLKNDRIKTKDLVADSQGKLHFATDCSGHEFGISGAGVNAVQPPILLPVTTHDHLRLMPGKALTLPIRIWNPGAAPLKHLRVELSSDYPTVQILRGSADIPELKSGQVVNLSSKFLVQFTSGDGDFAKTRLYLNAVETTAIGKPTSAAMHTYFDVLVTPSNLAAPLAVAVLDGRTKTFPTFYQGVHGGGTSVPRTVTEGKGNGNGELERGEQATIWLQVAQGLDPFDKQNWCRAKVYSDSPWITEIADLQENKGREWTSAQNRTSVIELNPATPKGTEVRAILDCETYSYTFTPDVRYGTQPLYQPYQFHGHQLYLWIWKVP